MPQLDQRVGNLGGRLDVVNIVKPFDLADQIGSAFGVDNLAAEGSRHKVVVHPFQQAGVTVKILVNNLINCLIAGYIGDFPQPIQAV